MSLNDRYRTKARKKSFRGLKFVVLLFITFGYIFSLVQHTNSWHVSSAEQEMFLEKTGLRSIDKEGEEIEWQEIEE